jgi:hypothetical protein
MANDFEDRQKQEILKNIDDPHLKDLANFAITSKDISFQIVTVGVGAACFAACAHLLTEMGDHTSSVICYGICGSITGYSSYTAFRRIWQGYSIPAKDYIRKFFSSKK